MNATLTENAAAIRRDVVRMIGMARSGHLASSLSVVDILAWLYWEVLSIRPGDPSWDARDRFILSKGQASPALYAALANRGYFSRDELWSYRRLGAMLQGYPQFRRTPGVDAPGGVLGQGLGLANGIALALRTKGNPARVFCLAGEEELREGAFWESAMTASSLGLASVVLLLERRETRFGGSPEDVPVLDPLSGKLSSFGWVVREGDGHDFSSLRDGLRSLSSGEGRPQCIVAVTRAGKGVSFIENDSSEGKMVLDRDLVDRALRELGNREVL